MNFVKIPNRKRDKIYYYFNIGRGAGQRLSTGIFIYAKPKDQIQKNHNKEALLILETKKSQITIESQAIGTPYIPQHKFKANFLDYYADYVNKHRTEENRHLPCSFEKFKLFVGKDFISPIEITEDFCKRFRKYLLDCLTGETPQNYFARFKWVINAATKSKYFHVNPTENISAISNPSVQLKEIIEADEYIKLINTPCSNEQIKLAFTFCLYTGLRWADIAQMEWADIQEGKLITRIIQRKTGHPVIITLHNTAQKILEQQRAKAAIVKKPSNLIFNLPTQDGANKVLRIWAINAGIHKHITWSCARLSFSVLLQDQRVDHATVSLLLGHTTTRQVEKTYKRHRLKPQTEAINMLPECPKNSLDKTEDQSNSINYVYTYTKL
jgi:integrase